MQTAGQVGAAARERTGSLVRVNRYVTGAPWPVPRGAAAFFMIQALGGSR